MLACYTLWILLYCIVGGKMDVTMQKHGITPPENHKLSEDDTKKSS